MALRTQQIIAYESGRGRHRRPAGRLLLRRVAHRRGRGRGVGVPRADRRHGRGGRRHRGRLHAGRDRAGRLRATPRPSTTARRSSSASTSTSRTRPSRPRCSRSTRSCRRPRSHGCAGPVPSGTRRASTPPCRPGRGGAGDANLLSPMKEALAAGHARRGQRRAPRGVRRLPPGAMSVAIDSSSSAAGPAGNTAATYAARLGAEVTLIERDVIGGAAHLWDCIPSKTMIATGGAMSFAHRIGGMGLSQLDAHLDLEAQRRRDRGDRGPACSDHVTQLLTSQGVRHDAGAGRLQGPPRGGGRDRRRHRGARGRRRARRHRHPAADPAVGRAGRRPHPHHPPGLPAARPCPSTSS